jgi:hypothetical protein
MGLAFRYTEHPDRALFPPPISCARSAGSAQDIVGHNSHLQGRPNRPCPQTVTLGVSVLNAGGKCGILDAVVRCAHRLVQFTRHAVRCPDTRLILCNDLVFIVLEYFLDNLFDIATIIIAGYLVIRHQVQPFGPGDITELATWILAVLGLLAVSGLWDRNRRLHRIEKLAEESRDLVSRHTSGQVRARDFFLTDQELSDLPEDTFSSASTIFLSGMTLRRSIRTYMDILERRLSADATIHVIIIDANAETVLKELTLRSSGKTVSEDWLTRLKTTETDLRTIADEIEGNGKRKFEVRHLPFIPSFGIFLIDPYEPHGSCYVELYHHRSSKANPAFKLKASDDPFWYEFFRRQYELLWESYTEVQPQTST